MVDNQIRSRGIISESVLNAMRKVARERFVPISNAQYAYEDHPLEIGHGQTISQPYIVALMTEIAAIRKMDRILEIGTGSGYQTAVLCEIAETVYSIERIKRLYLEASDTLEKEGYKNAHLIYGDGYQGHPDKAPYNAIIVTAAPEEVPQQLFTQLADGGRLVIPVGVYVQSLVVYERSGNRFHSDIVTGVRFVPMLHKTVEK